MMSPEYLKINFNGVNLGDAGLQLSIDNVFDERTEVRHDTSIMRPRDYVQWIPPRTVSLRYSVSLTKLRRETRLFL